MQLLIRKGQLNELVVTLNELADVDSPMNWLFVFEKTAGGDVYKKFLTDTSLATDRYNLFILTEPGDIDFDHGSEYSYHVYQMPDTDDTDETRGILVELGRLIVDKPIAPPVEYEADTKQDVYERQG